MAGLARDTIQSINEFLKMSMVPLPCQERHLSSTGLTNSESLEWLFDLKDKTPIWSRLNAINTSGFKRKLPMSMTKNYDIEIIGRLWSLWGHKRKHRRSQSSSKSYFAITIMALCAARVIRLNLWSSSLMDCIRDNGRKFHKKSLKRFEGCSKDFQLANLDCQCSLEGICFKVSSKAVQNGKLYNTPVEGEPNLALTLMNFFNYYQFGILECCNRILGIGLIDGPKRCYFMYDAQSTNYPLFPKNVCAPYILRTNHLQILLYGLIVSLNVTHMPTSFKLYHIQIELIKPNQIKTEVKSIKSCARIYPRIIPSKFWKTPSIFSLKCQSSKTSLNLRLYKAQNRICTKQVEKKASTKIIYRRKLHNITKEQEENGLIKPLVDPDRENNEDIQIRKDFVRMICSNTVVPLMPADLPKSLENEFSYNMLDVLIMGPKACIMFEEL